jgi:hypothetical protein
MQALVIVTAETSIAMNHLFFVAIPTIQLEKKKQKMKYKGTDSSHACTHAHTVKTTFQVLDIPFRLLSK